MNSITNFYQSQNKVIVSMGYDYIETNITLAPGHSAILPDPSVVGPYSLVWWNASDYIIPTDDPFVEVVSCIAKIGDTLIVMRSQQQTLASHKNIPGKLYNMIPLPGGNLQTLSYYNLPQPHGIASHTGIIGDHTANLSNVGSNTHTQIDTHIAAAGTSVHSLGTMSTQSAGGVTITGGSIAGITSMGIGTTSPSTTLDVNGNAKISGYLNINGVNVLTSIDDHFWKKDTNTWTFGADVAISNSVATLDNTVTGHVNQIQTKNSITPTGFKIRFKAVANTAGQYFWLITQSQTTFPLGIQLYNGNTVYYYGQTSSQFTLQFDDHRWHEIEVMYDGANANIWTDGQFTVSVGLNAPTAGTLYFSESQGAGHNCLMQFDYIKIYTAYNSQTASEHYINNDAYINGNVGIGTASPSAKLDIEDNVSGEFVALELTNANVDGNDFTTLRFNSSAYSTYSAIRHQLKTGDGSDSQLQFLTATANTPAVNMVIDNTGNVGIGTASPSTALQVVGTVTATTFVGTLTGAASSNVLKVGDTMTGALNLPTDGLVVGTNELVTSGGKVGIGTASPVANLDVAGGVINLQTALRAGMIGTIALASMTIVQGTWAQFNNSPQNDWDDLMVNQAGYFYNSTQANGDEIKLPNLVLDAGTYVVTIVTFSESHSGILEVLHGTTSLGTRDLYSTGIWNNIVRFTYSPTTRISAADLRFKASGHNSPSSGYRIAISRIQIQKVDTSLQTMGGTMAGTLAMGANQISGSNVSFTGGSITGITDLAIADGGTGASDAATARTNLGLGTLATQSGTFSGTSSGTNTGDNAANSSTHYIGTTVIALNRSSATQALTGITSIDGSANSLKSATTTVDVSAAAAPSANQVLTATSSTAATWQNISAVTLPSYIIKELTLSATIITNTGWLSAPPVAEIIDGNLSDFSVAGTIAVSQTATVVIDLGAIHTARLTFYVNVDNTGFTCTSTWAYSTDNSTYTTALTGVSNPAIISAELGYTKLRYARITVYNTTGTRSVRNLSFMASGV